MAKTFLEKTKRVLESVWFVPIAFLYGFVCWFIEVPAATAIGFSVFAMLIFLVCEKINNVYAMILYTPFFIRDITDINWTVYLVCIFAVGAGFVFFAVKTFVVHKKPMVKGKMFYALLVADAAFLAGGAIGRFNIMQFVLVLGFSVLAMLFYLLARNCTEDIVKYLAAVFVIGSVFTILQIACTKIQEGDLFCGDPEGRMFFFSAYSLNTASIYIMLGIAGCFMLGAAKKTDVVYFLVALLFIFGIFLSCCRTVLSISVLIMIAEYTLFIVYSPKKKMFLWLTLALVAATGLFTAIFFGQVKELVQMILDKLHRGLNGRDELWPWCCRKFLEFPVLGYGFIASETVPTVRTNLVLAHNTLLQWLTSLGVIGTALMSFFYIAKYKTLFKGFNFNRIFALIAILCIELSGMLDQAAAMDFFVFVIPIIIVCGVEQEKVVYDKNVKLA